jgi:hypothetical protein
VKSQQSLLLILPGLGSHSLTHSNNILRVCVCILAWNPRKVIKWPTHFILLPSFQPNSTIRKKKQKETNSPPHQIHEWQKEQYPKKEVGKAHILQAWSFVLFFLPFFCLSFWFCCSRLTLCVCVCVCVCLCVGNVDPYPKQERQSFKLFKQKKTQSSLLSLPVVLLHEKLEVSR